MTFSTFDKIVIVTIISEQPSDDLIFLRETWISDKSKRNLGVNGYISEHIPGNCSKNTTKGHFSGG